MNRFALTPLALLFLPLAACREVGLEPNGLAAARAPGEAASVSVEETFTLPVRTVALARAWQCNSPEPAVSLRGGLELDGLGSRLTFRSGGGGTPETQAQEDVNLVSAGDGMDVRQHTAEAQVEPQPYVWVKFYDDQGTALSEEIFLGRCIGQQGFTKQLAVEFSTPTHARADLAVSQCEQQSGPFVVVSGDLTIQRGVIARLIFDDTNEPGSHEATAERVVAVQYAPPGSEIRFQQEQARGDIGGNPSISFRYIDAQGEAIGQEWQLGQCAQLAAQ